MQNKIKCINPETNEVKYFIAESANDPTFMRATGFVIATDLPEDVEHSTGESSSGDLATTKGRDQSPEGEAGKIVDINPGSGGAPDDQKKDDIDDADDADEGIHDEGIVAAGTGLPDDIELNHTDATQEIEPEFTDKADLTAPVKPSTRPGKSLAPKNK